MAMALRQCGAWIVGPGRGDGENILRACYLNIALMLPQVRCTEVGLCTIFV